MIKLWLLDMLNAMLNLLLNQCYVGDQGLTAIAENYTDLKIWLFSVAKVRLTLFWYSWSLVLEELWNRLVLLPVYVKVLLMSHWKTWKFTTNLLKLYHYIQSTTMTKACFLHAKCGLFWILWLKDIFFSNL